MPCYNVNPLKCKWAVKETDWLGYWLTPIGLKPWHKKIDAILRLDVPRNAKEVCAFVRAITVQQHQPTSSTQRKPH
jgi:hypothetical protein